MQDIQEIISQKKFSTQYQKGLISFLYFYNQVKEIQSEVFKPYNITLQQYNVLRILRGQYPNPISIVSIKDRMLDKNSDVSRIIVRLLKSKYVITIVNQVDRRNLDIMISNEGIKILNQMDAQVDTIEYPFKALDEKEILQLNNYFMKMINTINTNKPKATKTKRKNGK